MNRAMEGMGGKVVKRYRLYRSTSALWQGAMALIAPPSG